MRHEKYVPKARLQSPALQFGGNLYQSMQKIAAGALLVWS